ncbi:hypothetical protein BJ964_004567 [Actinoplanes lobatus]|uniref:Uncharacterized protein n=1 Tax=Actinoplanes lobatus TaxID=113568 RepID=A0A7W7MHJ3_9ACTN|nr:hypothetical protein [Actinoplanes lobatus]
MYPTTQGLPAKIDHGRWLTTGSQSPRIALADTPNATLDGLPPHPAAKGSRSPTLALTDTPNATLDGLPPHPAVKGSRSPTLALANPALHDLGRLTTPSGKQTSQIAHRQPSLTHVARSWTFCRSGQQPGIKIGPTATIAQDCRRVGVTPQPPECATRHRGHPQPRNRLFGHLCLPREPANGGPRSHGVPAGWAFENENTQRSSFRADSGGPTGRQVDHSMPEPFNAKRSMRRAEENDRRGGSRERAMTIFLVGR